ncbi:MAG: hypothetical protein ACXAEN_27145, partial [Candidatus Thorarchaeota archaeon]
LFDSSGVYTISINSTVLSSGPISAYSIEIKMFWGDSIPYYGNSTTSTEASITTRFTQATVISTPPAFYFFNITVVVEYRDYLSGDPISGAVLTLDCTNYSSIQWWVFDNADGTYDIIANTTGLPFLGRYFFELNITWSGIPHYESLEKVEFSVDVNPVSTTLNFIIPEGVTYYLGDQVEANVTYVGIFEDVGVENATVMTDWGELYGTNFTIVELGNGVYRLVINTSGLNAQLYSFSVNATRLLHLNRSITADIVLAAIPVEIEMDILPADPSWGDDLTLTANVTDARNGNPIVGAIVNVTIQSNAYIMNDFGGGIYEIVVSTMDFISGEQSLTVRSTLLNHETREKDFQFRVDRIASTISASVDPQISVNGQVVTVYADYLILSNSSLISVGTVTYSWVGGTGTLSWNASLARYVGQFEITNTIVDTHEILVQAVSDNYKSAATLVAVEVREITTQLVDDLELNPFQPKYCLSQQHRSQSTR